MDELEWRGNGLFFRGICVGRISISFGQYNAWINDDESESFLLSSLSEQIAREQVVAAAKEALKP